jgi:two-component system, OmpR family, sensor histidine kinase RstB
MYSSDPIGAVINSLLDNAVKYTRPVRRSTLCLATLPPIEVAFCSLPRIAPSARKHIFRPGYRAEAAQQRDVAGMGLGLAVAMAVSEVLQLDLRCVQEEFESEEFPGYFGTRFIVVFDKLAHGLS